MTTRMIIKRQVPKKKPTNKLTHRSDARPIFKSTIKH